MKPTLDSRAYPLLMAASTGRNNPTVRIRDDDGGTRVEVELPKKNVLDEDGQADELTDAEQHDSVFLLEGPIWTSLSMEEKEKIQQGARMRHSMISFVENNARIKSHLNSGLYTKDVIDEVVDRTGALLPEHITSLLMGFFRELFTRMVGQFMQNNFAEDNVPGGGAGMGSPDVNRITGLLEKSARKTNNKITPAGVVAAAATAIIPLLFNVGGGVTSSLW